MDVPVSVSTSSTDGSKTGSLPYSFNHKPKTPGQQEQMMHKAEKKYEVGNISDEEEAKQRLLKSILNKLTPQNFEKLFQLVKQVNIDNVITLSGVTLQIFYKALMEPTMCEMYANFCFHLAGYLPDLSFGNEKITFKRLLLNKCQEEFERGEREEEEANKAEEEGEVKQTGEERDEKRLRARRCMLGNVRLIGELYKKRMLTERIMHECIGKLLGQYQNPDEEKIEGLCILLSTIGEMIDHPKAKEHMDAYFDIMAKVSNDIKLSSRVRFMLKDAIDLRKNKWQQRRKVESPKKIEEVRRDVAQERVHDSWLGHAPSMGNSSRRGPPMDFGARSPSMMLPSTNSHISGFPGSLPQLRGYGSQDVDVRTDERHSSPPEGGVRSENETMTSSTAVGYKNNAVGFRPGHGGNHGVLRNPRAHTHQYVGGILSGPMQSLGPPGGRQRNNEIMGMVFDEEEAKQRLLGSILNKLTPQNFEKLFQQVKQVNIDNVITLAGFILQIFDKALMEPTLSEMYANFCFHLAGDLPDLSVDNEKITFKRLLLNKCQEEFERGEREEEEANKAEEEGEVKQTGEERDEKRLRARRCMLGNVRLIGELYKKRMLTERIMHECIGKLLGQYQNPDEEKIEGLCILLSTIGEMIDHPKAKEHMDVYYDIMAQLSNNIKLSSRVRFMLKDAIDIRKNKWQQRRKGERPKKIEEVHRDGGIPSGLMHSLGPPGGPQRVPIYRIFSTHTCWGVKRVLLAAFIMTAMFSRWKWNF